MLGQVIRDFITAIRNTGAANQPSEQAVSSNPLSEYFYRNPGRGIFKWHHYFEIYHRHFSAFRGRSPVVVEIGVAVTASNALFMYVSSCSRTPLTPFQSRPDSANWRPGLP